MSQTCRRFYVYSPNTSNIFKQPPNPHVSATAHTQRKPRSLPADNPRRHTEYSKPEPRPSRRRPQPRPPTHSVGPKSDRLKALQLRTISVNFLTVPDRTFSQGQYIEARHQTSRPSLHGLFTVSTCTFTRCLYVCARLPRDLHPHRPSLLRRHSGSLANTRFLHLSIAPASDLCPPSSVLKPKHSKVIQAYLFERFVSAT